jgi:hypothetical protein
MSQQRAKRLPVDHGASRALLESSTVPPPFDPEEYARESDSRIRIETTPSSSRSTAPPPTGTMPEYAPRETSGTMQALGSVSTDAVPVLAVAREDLEWFDVAPYHRALLRYVDGRETIAVICARSCFKVDEALAAFHQLVRDGLITLQQ